RFPLQRRSRRTPIMSNYSITGGGFNAHVPEDKPAPKQVARAALPQPPVSAGYVTKNTDLPDSTKPVFDVDLSNVADGIRSVIAKHDRDQARANGDDQYDQRQMRALLGQKVAAGVMSNEDAAAAWNALYPGVDPKDVK